MGGVITHAPAHQLHQRFDRRKLFQPQLLFRLANARIDMLQYLLVQLLLGFEVVNHHAFGCLRLGGNLFHARPGQPVFGKDDDCGSENPLLQGLCFIMSHDRHNHSFFLRDKKYT